VAWKTPAIVIDASSEINANLIEDFGHLSEPAEA